MCEEIKTMVATAVADLVENMSDYALKQRLGVSFDGVKAWSVSNIRPAPGCHSDRYAADVTFILEPPVQGRRHAVATIEVPAKLDTFDGTW